jgi:hypothetical protein
MSEKFSCPQPTSTKAGVKLRVRGLLRTRKKKRKESNSKRDASINFFFYTFSTSVPLRTHSEMNRILAAKKAAPLGGLLERHLFSA